MTDTLSTAIAEMGDNTIYPQVCTPCMAKLDKRQWHSVLAVRTGPFVSGVRVNTPRAASRLEVLLAPLRVPDMDADVKPNFSVEIADIENGRGLHIVYRDHEVVARRRDAEELVADLAVLLDEVSLLFLTEALAVRASGVLTPDNVALLVPASLHTALITRRRRLEDAGLQLLRSRTQRLDAVTGELVFDPVDADLARAASAAGHASGRFPVDTWCVPAGGSEEFALTPGQGVYATFGTVVNHSLVGSGSVLEQLGRLAHSVRFVGLPSSGSSALAEVVIAHAVGPQSS